MSRVIIFSRIFPKGHPKAGQPTFFVEKIWTSLTEDFSKTLQGMDEELKNFTENKYDPKHHTIRAGNHWKVGDKFSPWVWSGKPYASKKIIIAPDIEIKKLWPVEINWHGQMTIGIPEESDPDHSYLIPLSDVAKNDGLDCKDFENWFKCHSKKNDKSFTGQIICWNESINY